MTELFFFLFWLPAGALAFATCVHRAGFRGFAEQVLTSLEYSSILEYESERGTSLEDLEKILRAKEKRRRSGVVNHPAMQVVVLVLLFIFFLVLGIGGFLLVAYATSNKMG